MTDAWKAGPTRFAPRDMGASTSARGFGRSVAELDPRNHDPLERIRTVPPRPAKGDVVVTGGSGFLGVRVVRALLARPGDERVYVCARRPGGIARAMMALAGADEASRVFADPRLVMLPVDLTYDDDVASVERRLATRSVRTVMHLAAAVDAFAPRERLANTNETATRNVIAFAASKGARLVHASTLSVFVSSDMGHEDRETSLRDRVDRRVFGGYAQTKAVADMLVEDAAARGLDACSLRLGLLVPERRERAETGSFLAAFRDALATVDAVPSTSEEAAVDLTPVDQAAACVVALADAETVPTFVHYANARSATLSMIVERMLGPTPTVLDDEAWDARVDDQPSIRRALLDAAFRKSRFLSARCTTRPLANADLFQSTARRYDVSTATSLGAPTPISPEEIVDELFRHEVLRPRGEERDATTTGRGEDVDATNGPSDADRRVGFMIGKFWPPTEGHAFLGRFALAHTGGDLTVMVESNDAQDVPGTLRATWMREMLPGAVVVNNHETLPQDPSETPEFWTIWEAVLRRHAPAGVTHVFASEAYGHRIAEILGAEFVPVDLERRCRDVSATRVRADPYGMWDMLPPPVRAHYRRRVTLIGPESSGKTTLAERLGRRLDTVVAPEYGRTWCDQFGTPDAEGLRRIARGHAAGVGAASPAANKVLIEDTDAAMTQVWADMLGLPRDPAIEAFWTPPDLYVVCDVDVPWMDDGQRWFPAPEDRRRFLATCIAEVEARGVPWTLASGSMGDRMVQVLDAMRRSLPPGIVPEPGGRSAT